MANFRYRGFNIKMNFLDRFFAEWWFGRQIPKNYICRKKFETNLIFLIFCMPIAWVVMHVPFFMTYGTFYFLAFLFFAIMTKPAATPLMGILLSIAAYYCDTHNVTFAISFFEYHLEHYLFLIIYGMTSLALLYYVYNFIIWRGVMRIHRKYEIPVEDQFSLRNKYTGYDRPRKKEKSFKTYTEALEYQLAIKNKELQTKS